MACFYSISFSSNRDDLSTLHTFGHPVAICCDMFHHVRSNIETVKFLVQQFGSLHLGVRVACQRPGAHKYRYVALKM